MSTGEKKSFWQIWLPIMGASLVYLIVLIVSYNHYKSDFENRKNETLSEYYKIILIHSLVKLNDLIQQLPLDRSGVDTIISIDKSDILGCYKKQCIKSNLFEFASTFDKYIPAFVYYKIEINKQLLHQNTKVANYELEKTQHINDYNQLVISLSADFKYFEGIRQKVLKPFFITLSSSTLLLLLFILSQKLLGKSFKEAYSSYYKSYYELELENLRSAQKKELMDKENTLMKKIWELEHSKEKDHELNHLFFQEANKLSTIAQSAEYLHSGLEHNNYQIFPYSILLYSKLREQEKIDIKGLVNIFCNRFYNSESNISISIESSELSVEFASKTFLYQIVYSVIAYILFILKEQSCVMKYNLRVNILKKQNRLCLLFEYDGFPFSTEDGLFKQCNKFLRKYANPFLISLYQIFLILKENDFNCDVGRNKFNFIEITKKPTLQGVNKTKSNVIKMPIKI